MKRGRKAALELSVGTIVIIVLAMTMLILGMVLVRTIMCGAVNLVTITEGKVKGEIDKLFQSTGGETVCIGSGEKPVTLIPGEYNTIWCAVAADQRADYNIKTSRISGDVLTERELNDWIVGDDFLRVSIAPGDDKAKKFLRLNVPKDAPHDLITVETEIYRNDVLISTQQLDFEIRKVGFLRVAVC